MSDDQIDPDISRWILEFLLRQPINYRLFISLFRLLPISDNDFLLKKLLLFRNLESEVSNLVVSEKVLEILDQIYELDQCLGIKECPDDLKKAYCCVAVECSVRCLRNSGNDVKGEFFDVVKRVWRGRVRAMEGGNVGLVSGELLEWRDDVEAAVWEESVLLKVVERSEGIDGVGAVRVYLREEKARMGPSFLELLTETLKSKEGVFPGVICSGMGDDNDQCRKNNGQELGYDTNDRTYDKGKSVTETLKLQEGLVPGVICSRMGGGSDQCGKVDGQEPGYDTNGKSYDKGKSVLVGSEKRNQRVKHVARKRSRLVTSGSARGAKITDVDDSGAGPSCNDHLPGTPEVDRVQEALESSRVELRAVVKDPLPDALRLAESVISISNLANKDREPPGDQNLDLPGGRNRGKCSVDNAESTQSGKANVGVKDMDFESQEDQHRSKCPGIDNALNVKSGEANAGHGICNGKTNAPKSLMERNKTARTIEWEDSIDRSSDEISDSSSRPHLPTPRPIHVSPLNIYKERKVKKPPRMKKRWSTLEEDTLRAGVEKIGRGHWKLILNAYRDVFDERTEVDLKDKWRNMTRYK